MDPKAADPSEHCKNTYVRLFADKPATEPDQRVPGVVDITLNKCQLRLTLSMTACFPRQTPSSVRRGRNHRQRKAAPQ